MLLLHEDLERGRGEGESVSEEWIRQIPGGGSRGDQHHAGVRHPRERSRIGGVADRRPEAQTASTAERRRNSSSRFCVISSSRTFFCSACRAPKSGASSRGDPLVVVDEPAEDVAPTNARAYGPFRGRGEIRWIEIESPMRSRSVVVIHVHSEDAL
jgi:hypothetical protein